ncbi:MAG: tetratricopeptide repeat protein [Bdellovibrionales bacterium]
MTGPRGYVTINYMAQDESYWLVKSSGRILGPYPTESIGELLKTREISVLDEISQPMRRWQTIQYHMQFKDVVESLRKASLSEMTEATWTPGNTTGITQTLTDVAGGELTEEITSDLDGFSTAKEIVIHNVPEQNQLSTRMNGRFQPQFSQESAIAKQADKTTRGLWIVTALVLLTVAAFIVHRKFSSPGVGDNRLPSQSLKQTVVNLIRIGHYSEALKELKQALGDSQQAGPMAIYYGSLLIYVDGQTVMGRRMLNSVLASKQPEVKQAYTGLGVADLIDGQLDSADSQFKKALSIDPDYVPAIVNRAAVAMQKSSYAEAKSLATQALKLSRLQAEAMLILAEAQLMMSSKTSPNAPEMAQMSKRLRDFQKVQMDYYAELGFLGLYFDFLRRDKGLDERVLSFLDVDPKLTQDHRHSPFIYSGRALWGVLSPLCESMTQRLGEGARYATLLASCYAYEQRWEQARQQIEKAVQQSPRDPLIQSWYAYILQQSGDADQASVAFARAMEFNRRGEYMMPYLLQARFSQSKGDADNAKASWQRLYERDTSYLPALAGMAWVNMKAKTYKEASNLIKKGLQIGPDYIPLLELGQKAELEGWYGAH